MVPPLYEVVFYWYRHWTSRAGFDELDDGESLRLQRMLLCRYSFSVTTLDGIRWHLSTSRVYKYELGVPHQGGLSKAASPEYKASCAPNTRRHSPNTRRHPPNTRWHASSIRRHAPNIRRHTCLDYRAASIPRIQGGIPRIQGGIHRI